MIDMTYDPEADAAYIYLGRRTIDRQDASDRVRDNVKEAQAGPPVRPAQSA